MPVFFSHLSMMFYFKSVVPFFQFREGKFHATASDAGQIRGRSTRARAEVRKPVGNTPSKQSNLREITYLEPIP